MFGRRKGRSKKRSMNLQLMPDGLAMAQTTQDGGRVFEFREREPDVSDADFIGQLSQEMQGVEANLSLCSSDYQLYVCDAPGANEPGVALVIKQQLVERMGLSMDDTVCALFEHPKLNALTQSHQVFAVLSSRSRLQNIQTTFSSAGIGLLSIGIPELALLGTLSQVVDDSSFAFLQWQGETGVLLVIENKRLVSRSMLPGLGHLHDIDQHKPLVEQFILALGHCLHEYMHDSAGVLYINPTAVAHQALLSVCKEELDNSVATFELNFEGTPEERLCLYQHGLCVWHGGQAS